MDADAWCQWRKRNPKVPAKPPEGHVHYYIPVATTNWRGEPEIMPKCNCRVPWETALEDSKKSNERD